MAFEEGNLRYQLRYFLTNLLEDDLTDSMVRVHLFASLQRAGIRIAEPQRTVHAVTRDQAHAETVRRRELTRRLEMLRGVDMFAALSDEEKSEVAERLQYAPFARGDIITKQGDAAHWLYIIAFGEAEVLLRAARRRAARGRHAARRPVLRRDGPAHRRGALRHGGGEDRRRVLPPRQGLVPGPAAVAARDRRGDRARMVGSRRGDLDQAREAFSDAGPVAEAEVRLATRSAASSGFAHRVASMSAGRRCLVCALLIATASAGASGQGAPSPRYPWDKRPASCFEPTGSTDPQCTLDSWPSWEQTLQQIDFLYEKEHFVLLERAMQDAASSQKQFVDGDSPASAVYWAFRHMMSPGHRGKLTRWREAVPASNFLPFAQARLEYASAWNVRGGGYAASVAAGPRSALPSPRTPRLLARSGFRRR